MKGVFNYMEDLRVIVEKSERLDKDGKPYNDLYLCWTFEDKKYKVRIKPQFYADLDKLYALAKHSVNATK